MAADGGPGNRVAAADGGTDMRDLPCEAWRGGWGLLSAVLALVAYPIQGGQGGGAARATEAELHAAVRGLTICRGVSPGGVGGGNCGVVGRALLRDYHGVRAGPFAVQRAALALTAALLEGRAAAVLAPLLTGEVEEMAAAAAADRPCSGGGAPGSLASGGSSGVTPPASAPPHEVSGMGLPQRLMAMLDSATRSPAGGVLEGFQLPPSPAAEAQSAEHAPAPDGPPTCEIKP